MDKPEDSKTTQPASGVADGQDLPAGNHPLEVAARSGFGPLSPLGQQVWHGQAGPCVSCGQLVPRDARRCRYCGQELTPSMAEKMRLHAGPWFVLEHLHPFPGISLDRVIRQIRRGLLTEVSIVRGPATDFQWRFAVETPGLCRYFGRCWSCHSQVSPSDTYCPNCLTYLTFEKPKSPTPTPPKSTGTPFTTKPNPEREGRSVTPESMGKHGLGGAHPSAGGQPQPTHAPTELARPPRGDLDMLRAALEEAPPSTHDPTDRNPPRLFGIRATWLAGVLLLAALLTLLWFAQNRVQPPAALPPQLVQPALQDIP